MAVSVHCVRSVLEADSAVVTLVTSDVVRAGIDGVDPGQLEMAGFEGKADQVYRQPAEGRVLGLVGLGAADSVDARAVRRAAASAARSFGRHERMALHPPAGTGLADSTVSQALAEGVVLGGYRYTTHKSSPDDSSGSGGASRLRRVDVVGCSSEAAREHLRLGSEIARGVCLARDLVNEPGGSLTAPVFARKAAAVARKAGLECTVWGEPDIRRERLGGLLGVNRGSTQPPRFVQITYEPKKAAAPAADSVAPAADSDAPAAAPDASAAASDTGAPNDAADTPAAPAAAFDTPSVGIRLDAAAADSAGGVSNDVADTPAADSAAGVSNDVADIPAAAASDADSAGGVSNDVADTPAVPAAAAASAADTHADTPASASAADSAGGVSNDVAALAAVDAAASNAVVALAAAAAAAALAADSDADAGNAGNAADAGTGADAPMTFALVGKGITFDAGGLSIKTAQGMMTMKMDMAGAAAVIGAMSVLPAVDAPARVLAFLPMTDNMLGGDATRPGDVLTIRNGKTIEVANTDAEGRLILADALSLASEAEPDAIVDLATLTGACMVALGPRIAGLMGNDQSLIDRVRAAADTAGERVWPLPLPADYEKQFESNVADIKNVGSPHGGALTAGLILQKFVADGIPWAHLDIAGPAHSDSIDGEIPKGGTGFGVRTLVQLVAG